MATFTLESLKALAAGKVTVEAVLEVACQPCQTATRKAKAGRPRGPNYRQRTGTGRGRGRPAGQVRTANDEQTDALDRLLSPLPADKRNPAAWSKQDKALADSILSATDCNAVELGRAADALLLASDPTIRPSMLSGNLNRDTITSESDPDSIVNRDVAQCYAMGEGRIPHPDTCKRAIRKWHCRHAGTIAYSDWSYTPGTAPSPEQSTIGEPLRFLAVRIPRRLANGTTRRRLFLHPAGVAPIQSQAESHIPAAEPSANPRVVAKHQRFDRVDPFAPQFCSSGDIDGDSPSIDTVLLTSPEVLLLRARYTHRISAKRVTKVRKSYLRQGRRWIRYIRGLPRIGVIECLRLTERFNGQPIWDRVIRPLQAAGMIEPLAIAAAVQSGKLSPDWLRYEEFKFAPPEVLGAVQNATISQEMALAALQ